MKDLQKIIDLISISGKPENIVIVGSFEDKKQKFYGDIDLHENISTKKSYSDILKDFQQVFIKLKKFPHIYITEFKAGFKDGKPIKWTVNEVLEGHKYIDDVKINFVDTLASESTIKLDLITFFRGEFLEITINYLIIFLGKSQTFPEWNEDVEKRWLLYQYQELKHTNFFKALKRLYSYYKLAGDKDNQKILLDIFNSRFGAINNQLNRLRTMLLLMKNKRRPSGKRMVKSLQEIKNNLENLKVDTGGLSNMGSDTLPQLRNKVSKYIDNLAAKLDDEIFDEIKKSHVMYIHEL